ncbi:DinB family protein [Dyadobacter sp. CY312]|uniref:DinB family protein n=1 Tax=Dyadobacter sp. CY312 TaxID=2907303 RepID=UPI001F2F82C1|nr:DinB family protein [Dyadobacter sp. CY312]MCE7041733.1 DinB family protein [Dyadobacter sp. CY312]
MTDRQYPIGRFNLQDDYSTEEFTALIDVIRAAPAQYRALVGNLSDDDLTKIYREGSWNIRQLVHHVSDIGLLHYYRMKKAITEPGSDMAVINMDAWAQTTDSLQMPVADSVLLFEAITNKYIFLITTLTVEQLSISYYHPVRKLWLTQKQAVAMSAWHVEHHLAHIRLALGE